MLENPDPVNIHSTTTAIETILKTIKNTPYLELEMVELGQKLVFGFGLPDRVEIVEPEKNNLTAIKAFLKVFEGTFLTANAKELYKLFNQNQLAFPSKFLDLEIGAFIENSERKVDLSAIIFEKYQIELTLSTPETQTKTEQIQESFFDEPEVTINHETFGQMIRYYYQLGSFYLDSFTPELQTLWQEVESPLATVLAKMEMAGVYINKAKLHETGQELSIQSSKLEQEILTLLDVKESININSSGQLAHALVAKGFNLSKKGSSGKLSVDKFVLESLLLEDESGIIQKILEYRTLVKLLSTYTENLITLLDKNSRLHCQFNQTQAVTGRVSSSNPNLQNIPIRNQEYGSLIRSCFAAPEGRLLISADYSQVELRLLAHFTKDPTLVEAFKLNQDIHKRTAAEIFEVPLDEVTSEQRRLGKTLNFALLYQQGSFATARQLGIKTKEAQTFIDKYFAAFATVKPFIEQVLAKAKETGYTESLFHRRRYFKYLNSTNKMLVREDQRAAFNMVLQGSNADLIKIAMIELDKKITEKGLDAILMLQVHDELVFEVAQKDSEAVASLVQDIMSNPPIKLNVPLYVDTKIGQNWSKT